jgi:catechol 2,3-dioxygenase-like lactoylglutathione lyase family enzyme
MHEPRPSAALGAFHHVTLGVTDLDAAVAFWAGNFGLTTRARREGPDAGLGALWEIPGDAIRRQALLQTPGATAGALHLVEFVAPDPAVREGARVYDRLPKNIDLYTRDLDTRLAELEAAGHRFRAPPAAMTAGRHVFREAQMPGPDGVNVVVIEAIGPGYDDVPLSPRGFAGAGPLVTIVPDVRAEGRFYQDLLGLAMTLDLQLGGPAIERAVGLPAGASLDLQVFGDPDQPLGRIEAIEYGQVAGDDLYPRARPPARGILHATWRIPGLDELRTRLASAGVAVTEQGPVTPLFGAGEVISFRSPAGFRIEVQAGR